MNNPVRPQGALKVAAVARRTGVSVRTLHYYEEIGLLTPSSRTAAGHRLYTPADVQRLQQIRSLQQLGLPLSAIGDCLAAESFDARQLIRDHLARVLEQRRDLERLEHQLRTLGAGIGRTARGTTDFNSRRSGNRHHPARSEDGNRKPAPYQPDHLRSVRYFQFHGLSGDGRPRCGMELLQLRGTQYSR